VKFEFLTRLLSVASIRNACAQYLVNFYVCTGVVTEDARRGRRRYSMTPSRVSTVRLEPRVEGTRLSRKPLTGNVAEGPSAFVFYSKYVAY
jgi:hypothetical protein